MKLPSRPHRSNRRGGAPADSIDPGVPTVPIAGRTLQVEIVTASGPFPQEAGARPMFLLGIVDHDPALLEVVDKLPPDAVGVAARVAAWLKPVFAQHGRPRSVEVRRADVATALGDALAEQRVQVRVKPRPKQSAAVIWELRARLDQPPIVNLPATVHRWREWDAPEPVLAAAVEAAATFYRAAPWKNIDDRLRLRMTAGSGATWDLLVLGAGGDVTGLAMVELAEDADLLVGYYYTAIGDDEEASPFDRLQAGIVQVDFNVEADLPLEMRREIRRARWPVAGPQAWPIIMATNTLGGAVAPIQFLDLTDAMLGLARLTSSQPDAVFEAERTGTPMVWRDEVSGASFEVASRFTGERRPWSMEPHLLPCLPQGPGAEPPAALVKHTEADLVADGDAVMHRFEAWLAGRPAQRRTTRRHIASAQMFVEDFLGLYQGIPVRAVTEYDLRSFLYDHMPRKVIQSRREALETLTSLRLLFQFLSEVEGIHAPWASEPLADKDALANRVTTCPGHFFWNEGVDLWRQSHDLDLRRRLLLHDGWLTSDMHFGQDYGNGMFGMGPDETRVEHELIRRWLIWRDELLAESGAADAAAERTPNADAAGTAPPLSPYRVFLALKERRERWAREAQPALGRRSPVQAVKMERKALLRRKAGKGRGRPRGRGRE